MNQREAYALLDSGSGREIRKIRNGCFRSALCSGGLGSDEHPQPISGDQTTARFDRKAGSAMGRA